MRGMISPTELLSDPLPAEPLQQAHDWLAEAWRRRPQGNPNAMTLATCGAEGMPSARIVLCKEIVPRPGYVVFYTNYRSRKGRELDANPRAAAVLHWDELRRQVRIEGIVDIAPAPDSDAYFASRALESRIGAWASAQSEPVASRGCVARRRRDRRPPFWGCGPGGRAFPPAARSASAALGAATACGLSRSSYGWKAPRAFTIGRAGRGNSRA